MTESNFHQLFVFYTVARLSSFSKAADELYISQPAVSNQVKLLEQRYGQPLFERLSRGIKLTQAGEIALDYARRIFALADEMEEVIADLRGVAFGRLVIGASTTIGEYLLPEIMGRFKERHPGVDMELRISNTRQVAGEVLRHELDLGFIGGHDQDDSLMVEPFAADEIVLFASPRHRLAGRTDVNVDDLRDEGFITREKGSATRVIAETHLRLLGVEPQVRMELGSNEAVKRAVWAGLGLGMLSRAALLAEVESGHLVVLEIPDCCCRRQLSLIYRRDKRLTSVEQAFLSLVRTARHEPGSEAGRGAQQS
ncbi:MAG: LysR family transcriptional regulator [Chloroflexi bacterium]|nr:LysR family transcriptional regulator [Chloroflexota bacterium]